MAIGDFQQTEVPQTIAPKCVGLINNRHATANDCRLDLFQEPVMGHWHPRFRSSRRVRLFDGTPFNMTGTTMQD
jgi:hypothetical protein